MQLSNLMRNTVKVADVIGLNPTRGTTTQLVHRLVRYSHRDS